MEFKQIRTWITQSPETKTAEVCIYKNKARTIVSLRSCNVYADVLKKKSIVSFANNDVKDYVNIGKNK